MEQFNLLTFWSKNFYYKTSILHSKKHDTITREAVDFIKSTFIDFFGENYFNRNRIKYTQEQKIILSRNPFFQLLISESDNSFFSLLDLASLIKFSKKYDESIYSKLLTLRKDFTALRNYLFEVFIYRSLINSPLPFATKPVLNGKELEAVFVYNSRPGIIECKKIYSSEINRYSHLQDNFHLFFNKWMSYQVNIFAFILAPSKDEKQLSEEKEYIKKGIGEYFLEVRRRKKINFIFERFNSKGQKILHIEKNSPGIFENLQRTFKVPFAFFSAHPPPVINAPGSNFFHFYNGYYFSFWESEIQDKILREIDKKRRQHKEFKNDYRIFFFENEGTTFGEIPLMTEKTLKSNIIQSHLDSKDSKDLVCVIDKNFLPNRPATVQRYIYCKSELNPLKEIIENLDFKLFHC